jgi:hypothetical protein
VADDPLCVDPLLPDPDVPVVPDEPVLPEPVPLLGIQAVDFGMFRPSSTCCSWS